MTIAIHGPETQQALDESHLNILKIMHIIQGCIKAFGGIIVLLYFGFISFVISIIPPSEMSSGGRSISEEDIMVLNFMKSFFWIIFFVVFVIIAVITAGSFFQAYCLQKRKHSTLCLILAALDCLSIPYGTILGIYTFLVLMRPSVKTLFSGASPGNYST